MKRIAFFLAILLLAALALASRVLVVHSYDEGYTWTREIQDGILAAMDDETIEWDFFFMDSRLRPELDWKIKAGQLAALRVEQFQPDLVIACDDIAQEFFGKTLLNVPLVFCGVNNDPAMYGYPRENVSGVRETNFFPETVSLLDSFFPQTTRILLLGDDSETSRGMIGQLPAEGFPGMRMETHLFRTFQEWKDGVANLPEHGDAIVMLANRGLIGQEGQTVSSSVVTEWTVEKSLVPVFSVSDFHIPEGAAGGVVNSGFSQGFQAGTLALRVLRSGKPASSFPVEYPENPITMVNLDSLLGWDPVFEQGAFSVVDHVVSRWPVSADSLLRLLVRSFEERAEGILTSLRVMAKSSEVISGNWQSMKPLLQSFNEMYAGLGIFILPDGGYYSVPRNWTGLSLANRDYFSLLLNGEEVHGYQVLSRSTGKRSLVFAVPVPHDGKMVGFLGLSAFFDSWNENVVSELSLPPELHFYAFDAQNTLALTDRSSLLLGSLDIEIPGISQRLPGLQQQSGSFLFTENGELHLGMYRKSLSTGWTFLLTKTLGIVEEANLESLLSDARNKVQQRLTQLDDAIAEGARSLGHSFDEEEMREVLRKLHRENPDVIDVSWITTEGILRWIEPEEYHAFEGAAIGGQEQFQRMLNSQKPSLSDSFLSVEGIPSVDLEWPLFTEQGQIQGALSFLIKYDSFLAPLLVPLNVGSYEFWMMQTDGTIFFDQDAMEIGRNLFTDPLYQPYAELRELGQRITANPTGEGSYSFFAKGMQQVVEKQVMWTSVGLHGTQWRLIVTRVVP